MTDQSTTANAGAEESPVANTNMSVTEFANRRLGEMTQEVQEQTEPQEEVTEETEEQVTEEVTDGVDEIQEETEEVTENEEDVLSQIDLDTMSEDELRELSEKLGSKAVARFGALTAKRKAAEERLAELEAKLSQQNPLETPRKVDNNPFSNLDSVEELQAKSTEVENIIEWAEDLLFESDAYAPDDVVTEVDGKELTKADIRKHLLQARKSQKTFLPDQLQKIQAREKGEELEVAFKERAESELSWMKGEDNDTRKQYESIINDQRFQKLKTTLKKESPELSGQLDYFFAHAANSIYGRKPIGSKQSSPTLNPPRTGPSGSARSDKGPTKTAKALKDLQSRFRTSGNARDFAEMRKLQMANRR
jgi:hypothetical protein